MLPHSPPLRPWQTIATDIIGPLPRSTSGYSYILVVVDTFSKYALLFKLRKATAGPIVHAIEDNVILTFGAPQKILCDNGVQYRSREFTSLAQRYDSKIVYNALYHPQANPAERTNRVVKTMIASYVSENHRQWDKHLAEIACALRTARHEVTGYSPYYINHGRKIILKGTDYGK